MSDTRFNSIKSGGVVTIAAAGTRQKISVTSLKCRRAIIQALDTNTSAVVIGGPTVLAVSGTGIILPKGATFQFNIEDLAYLYADARVSGDKISYVYFD